MHWGVCVCEHCYIAEISYTPDEAAQNTSHMDRSKGCNYSFLNSFVHFLFYDYANPVWPVESRYWIDCERLLYKHLKFPVFGKNLCWNHVISYYWTV